MSKSIVVMSIAALAAALAGCGGGVITKTFGPEIPPQTQEVPREYPNVYTSINRPDTLKSGAARQAEIDALREAGDTHVETAVKDIENR